MHCWEWFSVYFILFTIGTNLQGPLLSHVKDEKEPDMNLISMYYFLPGNMTFSNILFCLFYFPCFFQKSQENLLDSNSTPSEITNLQPSLSSSLPFFNFWYSELFGMNIFKHSQNKNSVWWISIDSSLKFKNYQNFVNPFLCTPHKHLFVSSGLEKKYFKIYFCATYFYITSKTRVY